MTGGIPHPSTHPTGARGALLTQKLWGEGGPWGAAGVGRLPFHFSRADYYGRHGGYLSPPLPLLFI